MTNVTVITGGGSGMGLETAKFMPKDKIGYAIATVSNERNGYLAGVDILCDGGSTNGREFKKASK